jgi:hypothetical protein
LGELTNAQPSHALRERRGRALMPLLTLGQAVAAKVRLIVWCKTCLHRFEPNTGGVY